MKSLPVLVMGAALTSALALTSSSAHAADLVTTQSGKITVEMLSSDATFHNTLSLVTPAGAVLSAQGCALESSPGLAGVRLMSEKVAVHGCRAVLDADAGTAGVQGFPAGTALRFNMCAQTDSDPECDFVWSSNDADNSDGSAHVHITELHAADFPGRAYEIRWEDKPTDAGDNDFNDLIAVVRIDGDADGDGLWDDWERFGADTDGDGVVDLDLPAAGANPNHKDIFVEVDFMDCTVSGSDCASGDTHNHRPKAAAITAAVNAFRNAPVTNPDGVNGINLHIDVSNAVAHQNNLNINGLCFNGGAGIGSFDAVKADPANFGPGNPRRYAYRYNLWTHQQISTSTSSGCAELPGNDFQVALGGWNTGGAADVDGDGLDDRNVGTIQQQAGTLIHEMGHTLNLGHGGFDGTNYKPNYLSLMSYFFQTAGIPPTDPDGAAGPLGGQLLLSSGAIPGLTETSLNENTALGTGTNNSFYYCPNATVRSIAGTGRVDWNCNGVSTDTGVTNDVNNDRGCVGAGPNGVLDSTRAGDDVIVGNTINDGADRTCNSAKSGDDLQLRGVGNVQLAGLSDYDDWNNLQYGFQQTGAFEDGVHTSRMIASEIDYATFVRDVLADLALTVVGPTTALTGTQVVFDLRVHNLHPDQARQVLIEQVLPAGLSFVACALTGGVVGSCGGSGANRTVSFPALVGGESASATMTTALSCSLAHGAVLTTTATVSALQGDPDASNNSAQATVIAQNPPPVLSAASPSRATLWPPNHALVDVTVGYTVTDNCPGTTCALSVTSSEPANGTGDGDTGPDFVIVDDHHVKLRAERAGNGPGRTYTIGVLCGDSGGGVSSTTTSVRVPHNAP
jgi:uncharacterized repeat protein (TIGR01451 family)